MANLTFNFISWLVVIHSPVLRFTRKHSSEFTRKILNLFLVKQCKSISAASSNSKVSPGDQPLGLHYNRCFNLNFLKP